MTIYEQIQNAVDYIEKNLFERQSSDEIADSVFMSSRSFYNYFWIITGYTYKEYVIKRRLTEAAKILSTSNERIYKIAFEIGYESHEAFTRAFRHEFKISPLQYRKSQQILTGQNKINLINEIYMGVIIKELPKMEVVCFEGYAPDPEIKAFDKMKDWLNKHKSEDNPKRIFGHNIDLNGKLTYDPQNAGYKVLVAIEDNNIKKFNVKTEIIEAGRFIVTGIEGNIQSDGKWIMEGWGRLNKMIEKGDYKIKKAPRWFEEHLEPSKPGNLRLDLYLEIE